jgi:hypothetical protein
MLRERGVAVTQESYRTINLFNWTGGIVGRRRNPLHFTENALAAGENVDLADGTLRTRPGSTLVSSGSLPSGAVVALKQVRFPTNEVSYLVAQVKYALNWQRGTEATTPRTGHSAIWDTGNGRMLVFGGNDSNDLLAYDPDADIWITLSPSGTPPHGRSYHSAIYYPAAEIMVVFGGTYNDGSNHYLNDLWVYACQANLWMEILPTGTPPSQRASHIAVLRTDNDSMIVAQGDSGDLDIYVLDLATWAWSSFTPTYNPNPMTGRFPYAHSAGAYDPVNDQLIVVGGQFSEDVNSYGCYALDLTNHVWTRKASVSDSTDPAGITDNRAVYCSGKVSICGDYGTIGLDDRLTGWTYTVADDSWAQFVFQGTTQPVRRYGHSVCLSDIGSLLVFGGDASDAHVWRTNELCARAANYGYGLYACPDNLPTSAAQFTKIFDLGANAGKCTLAVLNDRCVITEGIAKPPLVWGGCMSNDGSDWMHPKAVLIAQDGEHFYDISQEVCDKDSDTAAQVGGIRPWGHIDICCDMPEVEGFYFKMQTPNTGAAGTTTSTFHAPPAQITQATDINREDLKRIITHWVQDYGATGHFAQVAQLDEALVTDRGAGKVGLPCTNQPFSTGDSIIISGTTHYNGTFTIDASSTADLIVITHSYTMETLTSTAIATNVQHPSLGTGNTCPDVTPGVLVEFGDAEVMITAVTGDGTGYGVITLSALHASAEVSGIYGIQVTANGATINSEYGSASTTIDNSVAGSTPLAGYSLRMVIPGSSITRDGDHIQITLKNAATEPSLPPIAPGWAGVAWSLLIPWELKAVSIVPRDGETANGTEVPTPITFNNGRPSPGVPYWTYVSYGGYPYNSTFQSDIIPFNVTPGQDLLLILDMGWSYNKVWDGRQFRSGELPGVAGTSYIRDYGWGNVGASATEQTVTGFTEVPYLYALSQLLVTNILAISPNSQVATSTDLIQYDASRYEGIDSVAVDQHTPGNSQIFHAMSFDDRQTFKVFLNSVWRVIIRNNGGTWQYIDGADAWRNADVNSLLGSLRQALAVSANQMTKDQLEAMTAENWQASGGFVPHITRTLDFAFRLVVDTEDLENLPVLSSYTMIYESTAGGQAIIEGFKNGTWTGGDGWMDGTIVNNARLGQSGTIVYAGDSSFKADYHVVDQIPGFWYRLKTNGTSPECAITEILYKAPCQPLANIGDGQSDIGTVILSIEATGAINDLSVLLADNSLTSLGSAAVPMQPEDYLYVGYLTRFSELEITPYADPSDTTFTNNQAESGLSAQYWNGEAWSPLTVVDGTTVGGVTLTQRGRVSWTLPDDWKTSIPFDASFSRGFWVRLHVSSALTETSALSELRVYGVPDTLKKHKFVATFGNRIALGNRPDAPDQIDISRPFEEYGFVGQDAESFRLGGTDQIISAIPAWNGLLIGKTDTFHFIEEGATDFRSVEAARHVPINSQVIVKAPVSGFDYGDRYGLFFLNRYGAFVSTGLHTDSLFNTSRGKTINDVLDWWDTSNTPRLDLDYLHLACGEYWPARNWIVWAVPMILSSEEVGVGSKPIPTNNRLIVYDLTLRAWLPPFTVSAASLCSAYHRNDNAVGKLGDLGLYAGDYEGRILRLFGPGVTQDLSSPISAWVETGWLDLGLPDTKKLLRMLSLYGRTADDVITVSAFGDGDTSVPAVAEFRDLSNLESKSFAVEQKSSNVQGRFFKFRIDFSDASEVYGLQIATSLIRQWGAL